MSEDVTVQYGTDFNLTCHFVGTPSPMVEWWFDGDPVNIGEYKTHDQVSVLTVKNFSPPEWVCISVLYLTNMVLILDQLLCIAKVKTFNCSIKVYYCIYTFFTLTLAIYQNYKQNLMQVAQCSFYQYSMLMKCFISIFLCYMVWGFVIVLHVKFI